MKYDFEKRTFLVEKFHQLQSITKVQRAWRTKYVSAKAPTASMIKTLAEKFKKTGSVSNAPRVRPKSDQKRNEAKNTINDLITKLPNLSICKVAQASNVSYTMARSILKEDLKLKPYKEPSVHMLQAPDYKKRLDFAHWYFKTRKLNHEKIICTDEAYFYLTKSLNKQNNRFWLNEKTLDAVEKPLQDKRLLVFCAISAEKIYGPFYFSTTVNQHNYLEMLEKEFWRRHLDTKEYKKYYFQQDGAPAHRCNLVQKWLTDKFGDKFINKDLWPPRSPDLNPCDFFLWGYLKDRVYSPLPKNLDDLKANIENEIKKISKETLKNTFLNFEKRMNLVIKIGRAHV